MYHAGATVLSRFLFLFHPHQLSGFESSACCADEGLKTYSSTLLGAPCGFCGYRSRVALGSRGHQVTAELLGGQGLSHCPGLPVYIVLDKLP